MTENMTNPSLERPLALVLGATGGIGGALASALLQRGYRVRAMHRAPERQTSARPRYAWVRGDAMRAEDVLQAAEGASVIVHGVNPPGYQNWAELVLPMIDNTIAAARAVGARILMPGTIYNFGRGTFPLVAEDSRQEPETVKGRIRVELERRLEQAAAEGVPVIVVRAGDFFGPEAGNNWFAQGLVQPSKPVRFVINPGRKGVGHAWAYLPDVAETFMRLLIGRTHCRVSRGFTWTDSMIRTVRRWWRRSAEPWGDRACSPSVFPGVWQDWPGLSCL